MDDLEDELDLRFHRGLKPEVYYRCPSLESLTGALRNELEKNAASLIPVKIVTEFVFSQASTITVPVAQQPDLEALFQPAEYSQSITVDDALCRGIEGKDRLKLQRAIARSFIGTIQEIDGFRYLERRALNKDGSDGIRFKYVCADSLQNRRGHAKKAPLGEAEQGEPNGKRKSASNLSTYECDGAVHIKFSTSREAINVIYIHNPIHRDIDSRSAQNGESQLPDSSMTHRNLQPEIAENTKKGNRKRKKRNETEHGSELNNSSLEPTSSDSIGEPPKKQQKKKAAIEAVPSSSAKTTKKVKPVHSPSKSRKQATSMRNSAPEPALPAKGECLRCREKKIKCNEVRPTCNQCHRGLWMCQYELPGTKKRSKNGCLNCKTRKRKCTEEKPFCAYCLKVDDDCVYAGSG